MFKNSKKNRDEVVSYIQNSSENVVLLDVLKHIDKINLDKQSFMYKWISTACFVNSMARKTRLEGKVSKAVEFEQELEKMVETGEVYRKV